MNLTLHIGTEKTGTTTLQTWFSNNREALDRQGVHYPTAFGRYNHHFLALYALEGDTDDAPAQDDGTRVSEDVRKLFDEELQAHGATPQWIISSELLHSRLTTRARIERVRDLLAPHFESIRILIHLRPQADMALSLASTWARMGQRISRRFFERIGGDDPFYDLDALVARWESVFGPDRVEVVPYKRERDLTARMIEELAIDTAGLGAVQTRNQAYDWRTIALLNCLGSDDVAMDDLKDRDWSGMVAALPTEQPLVIGEDLARAVQERFEASNARLIARREELLPGDLTPDWSRHRLEPNIDRLEQPCVFDRQLAMLMEGIDLELRYNRLQLALAATEIALLENRFDDAVQALLEARNLYNDLPRGIRNRSRVQEMREKFVTLLERAGRRAR